MSRLSSLTGKFITAKPILVKKGVLGELGYAQRNILLDLCYLAAYALTVDLVILQHIYSW